MYLNLLARYLIPFLILSSSPDSSMQSNGKQTLQFVQMIFRHGDKTPVKSFPKDPFRNGSIWPGGWSNITEKGKRRLYSLGIYFRQRYQNLLSREYTEDEIEVMSSDYDRTVTSAMCFVTGFYRNNEPETKWNGELDWNFIHIKVLTKGTDRLKDVNEPCPKMLKIFDSLQQSKFSNIFFRDNKAVVQYIANHSGIPETKGLRITTVVNTLQIEAENGLELEPWTKRVFESKPMMTIMREFHKYLHKNKMWTILRAGPLAEKLISNMEEYIAHKNEIGEAKKKMVVYAAHDRTLMDLMIALNVYDLEVENVPPYGATFILELHRIDNNYFVEALYKNDSSTMPYKLAIPNCGNPCEIDDFKSIASNLIPKDWKLSCQLENNDEDVIYVEDDNMRR